MPLYEYICRTCGQPFERLVSFSQTKPAQACPSCQSTETERKLSTFAVGGTSRATGTATSRPSASPFT